LNKWVLAYPTCPTWSLVPASSCETGTVDVMGKKSKMNLHKIQHCYEREHNGRNEGNNYKDLSV
jgi:hypothetical protein